MKVYSDISLLVRMLSSIPYLPNDILAQGIKLL